MRLGLSCLTIIALAAGCATNPRPLTPVGVAKIDITPDVPVRMYGYASRKTESEGVAGRLKASAIVIGADEGDGPAILLSVDNGSVPPQIREKVLNRLQSRVQIKPERFMLCNTHIHSGPDLDGMASLSGEQRAHLDKYASQLTDQLEQVVLKALSSRRPGHLDWTTGTVNFAMNRRVLKDGKWSGFGATPSAPTDHTLRLLRITDADGKLLGLLINYACHNTTLRQNFTRLHADWSGCAQQFIESDQPGVVAAISLGCGADSDPWPHGTAELCEQHGREMAAEVKRLLAGPFKPIDPRITARMQTLEIPFDAPPPTDELRELAKKSYPANELLKLIESGQQPPKSASYPIAAWTFGNDLAMVFLSNEVVVDYATHLSRELDARRLWVNAYSNQVACYIASDRLLKEGGYEVNNSISAKVTYGRPDRLVPTMEERIVSAVKSLVPVQFQATARQPLASDHR